MANNSFPHSVRYIIGNEAAERFSFYGMKNILTFFMINYFLLKDADAKSNYHLFVSAVYFFPLLGGVLADRLWGKYKTIFWLSLVYCVGHLCLALFENNPQGFYVGLGLIALGAGGIKPCVAAFVGDQFDESNKHLIKVVFGWFYWMINFGSFFASALIPKTLEWFGPKVAFGIPGVLMFLSTVILWLGRKHYVDTPPVPKDPHGFIAVVRDRFDVSKHPAEAIDGARAVLRVMGIFAMLPAFWALYDQKASSWVVQAMKMDREFLGLTLAPAQFLAVNPVLIMMMIPFFGRVFYPWLEKVGLRPTPLRRMAAGMFFAALSFVVVGGFEMVLESGQRLSIAWHFLPYFILTFGEVLLSTTGLEFAYTQAPPSQKSTIMSVWYLTTTVGNLLTAVVAKLNMFAGSGQYFFFAVLMVLAGVVFSIQAGRYVSRDWIRQAT